MNACFLCYDIPDSADVANPSGRLRRRAVRINLSCWVIREQDIPHHLLHNLSEKGATWYVIKFDASEASHLVQLARDSLKKDLAAAEKRAQESAERAAKQLAAAQDGDDDEAAMSAQAALTRYLARIRALLKRTEKLASDLAGAGSRFGIASDSLPLDSVSGAAEAIRLAAHERAREFARMAVEAGKLGPNGAAMLAAAKADDMPPLILADYLEERGVDTTKARQLFSIVG